MNKKNRTAPGKGIPPLLAIVFALGLSSGALGEDAPRFNRDIRPILSENCFQCHGFDSKHRKAGLRLDDASGASAKLESGKIAIIPGDAGASEMLRVLSSDDPDVKMPPPDSGKSVSLQEIGKLRQWIDSGAKFERHWAFVSPEKKSENGAGGVAIDRLVRKRLQQEKLKPNPQADTATLYRRFSIDLIGLPPNPDVVDDFVREAETDFEAACERAVDHFLKSRNFGEKWARWWLDVSHYADTAGYTIDYDRPHAWRYRDWVVNAFNRNQPFDQFTIEQIAGDLLPGSSDEQKTATGFFRNTLSNREGGADLEEFRVKQVKDRVRTFGAAWLGLTIECSECHDHKFDPFLQRDFYSLYAFFNNTDEINITAALPGEAGAYEAALVDYRKKRAELIDPVRRELETVEQEWERRVLAAEKDPGIDAKRDRLLELLGILWGKGEGEGQLEGIGIIRTPLAERSVRQKERLLDFFLERGLLGFEVENKKLGLSALGKKLKALSEALPEISRPPALADAVMKRETRIQSRGDFRTTGELVSAGVPGLLHDLKTEGTPTRLDLARWVVAVENPVTARVIVNRIWHEIFGHGLVETTEDFGAQGSPPSHPELLDSLALDFVGSGWDVKALLKQIVSSATYRQSSVISREMQIRDPENKLLARHPRIRLSGELVRDSALSVSGLLDPRIGGPAVHPPQPNSVSVVGSFSNKWVNSKGGDRYRRGIYTFLQRTSPYAQFQTFDLPNVNQACTRRGRSNTPLQALTLLNDPVFVEAAKALADRMVQESRSKKEREITRQGFRLALAREPDSGELDRLEKYREDQISIFQKEKVPTPEKAARVAIASVLLNLDEFITKE